MTEEELIARAEDLTAAWNQRDVDRIVAAFHPDVQFRDAVSGGSALGRAAVRADAEACLSAFPDLTLAVRRTVATGHVVIQEWMSRTTAPGADEDLERPGLSIADYDPTGRIVSFARYWSLSGPLTPSGS